MVLNTIKVPSNVICENLFKDARPGMTITNLVEKKVKIARS